MKFGTMKSLGTWMIGMAASAVLQAAVDGQAATDNAAEYGDRPFDSLTVGDLSFSNVWVHQQANAVIFIKT